MTDPSPIDPAALVKEANTALRLSQNAMMSGKHDQAAEQLAAATAAIGRLAEAQADHRELKGLQQKLERQRADLERRRPKQAQPTSAAPAPAAPAAALPANFLRRLRLLSEALDKVEEGLGKAAGHPKPEERLKQARADLASARADGAELIEQIGKGFFKGVSSQPPELAALLARAAETEQKVASSEARLSTLRAGEAEIAARRDSMCGAWVARLAPYVTGLGRPGHDPEKYLIAAGTADVAELNARKRIWEQASAEFSIFRQAAFPDGKTELLQDIEGELERALGQFAQAYTACLGDLAEAAEKEVDQALEQLAGRSAWRTDPGLRPLPLAKDHLQRIESLIDQAAKAVPERDARLAAIRQKYAGLAKADGETRKALVERTFMTPDRFSGPELEELRSKARETAEAQGQGAAILRVTVISPDWKDEDVIEFTDTTRSELRRRVTRSVTAQAAGTLASEAFLYTVHLAKDRLADGSFGSPRGHVIFSDRMLPENIERDAR